MFEHQDDDSHYRLTFINLSTALLDPGILDTNGDVESDQLAEGMEFLISTQDSTVQSRQIDGYDGTDSIVADAVAGCAVGGVVGAILGFINSNAWLRTVDYHPAAWASIQFFLPRVDNP